MEAPAGRTPRPARQAGGDAGNRSGAGHHLLPGPDRTLRQPRCRRRGLCAAQSPQPGLPRQATLMSEHSDLQVPSAAIYGCAGLTLSAVEESFFKAANPLGFILFARNCETPDQVRELVAALLGSVGRADAPVLLDQEGGRVARGSEDRRLGQKVVRN